MSKNRSRREKFQRIGAAIGRMPRGFTPHFDDRDYHTGKESQFHPTRNDRFHRDPEDPLNKDKVERTEIGFGPTFKTPQWDRTVDDT